MFGIGSRILSFVFGGTTLVLLVALGVVLISKNGAIRELRRSNDALVEQNEGLRTNLNQARANIQTLEGSLANQTNAIRAMERSLEQRTRELARIREDTGSLRRQRDITARQGETCEDADSMILEILEHDQ